MSPNSKLIRKTVIIFARSMHTITGTFGTIHKSNIKKNGCSTLTRRSPEAATTTTILRHESTSTTTSQTDVADVAAPEGDWYCCSCSYGYVVFGTGACGPT